MIRPMELSDLEQVCRIEKAVFSEPWSENSFRSSLENVDYYYLTAVSEDGAEILGYCGYLRSFETADITNMAVKEEARGCGTGRALLKALMQEGYRRGIERFTLEVRKSNAPAIRLYESLGFRTEGVRKNFYALPTEDALIMWTPEAGETAD